MPKQILIADSTQINCFLECKERWRLSHLENLTRFDGDANKKAMHKGTYGHKLLELYYKSKTNSLLAKYAMEYAIDWIPELDICTCGRYKDKHIEDQSLCAEFTAAPYPLTQEEIIQVQNRFRLYCATYEARGTDIEPVDMDSIELGFSNVVYESDDYLFILEGKIDLIGKIQNIPIIMDHKWQDRARRLYSKSIQFRNYCWAAECDTLVVNYIRMAAAVNNETFVRDITSFSKQELTKWKEELTKIFFEMLAYKIKPFYLGYSTEKNWASCSGKFGYQCEFTQICEQQFIPAIDLIKSTQYKQKQEWRPW